MLVGTRTSAQSFPPTNSLDFSFATIASRHSAAVPCLPAVVAVEAAGSAVDVRATVCSPKDGHQYFSSMQRAS
jgi:hypothetical protein